MTLLTERDALINDFADRLEEMEERLKIVETHSITSQPGISDQVLLNTLPVFNVESYGASAVGVDPAAAAFQAALDDADANGGIAYFGPGTYNIEADLSVGQFAGFMGAGAKSILRASAAINVVKVINVGASGNKSGRVGNFYIDCNSIATRGLYGELSVRRDYHNIDIWDAVSQGMELDNCQNNTLRSILISGCPTGLKLDENSSNNRFLGGNVTNYSSYGLRIDTVTLAAPGRNTFLDWLFEQATGATHALNLADGVENTFIECSFGRCAGDTIAIASGSWGNTFIKNLFDGDRSVSLPLVDNDAPYTRLEFNTFQNAGGNFTLGDVVLNNSGSPLYIFGNRWRLGDLTNTGSIRQPEQSGDFVLKTISGGAISIYPGEGNNFKIAVESGSSDILDTINGGWEGMKITLKANDNAETITIDDAAGNIYLAGSADFDMDHSQDKVRLVNQNGTSWVSDSPPVNVA